MTQGSGEELEVAREGVRRFAAGDIAGLAELYTPDAVMIAPEGWPEGTRFDGREEVMRQFARIQEEWSAHAIRFEREASRLPWVVLGLVWEAEGRASGAPIQMQIVGAYRIEDGLHADVRFYWRFEDALEDLGLDAQDASAPASTDSISPESV